MLFLGLLVHSTHISCLFQYHIHIHILWAFVLHFVVYCFVGKSPIWYGFGFFLSSFVSGFFCCRWVYMCFGFLLYGCCLVLAQLHQNIHTDSTIRVLQHNQTKHTTRAKNCHFTRNACSVLSVHSHLYNSTLFLLLLLLPQMAITIARHTHTYTSTPLTIQSLMIADAHLSWLYDTRFFFATFSLLFFSLVRIFPKPFFKSKTFCKKKEYQKWK